MENESTPIPPSTDDIGWTASSSDGVLYVALIVVAAMILCTLIIGCMYYNRKRGNQVHVLSKGMGTRSEPLSFQAIHSLTSLSHLPALSSPDIEEENNSFHGLTQKVRDVVILYILYAIVVTDKWRILGLTGAKLFGHHLKSQLFGFADHVIC